MTAADDEHVCQFVQLLSKITPLKFVDTLWNLTLKRDFELSVLDSKFNTI